jgi:hypothetical protein
MIDFAAHPWQTWYSTTHLPGASIARYAMEYRAYRTDRLFQGLSPSLLEPFKSLVPSQVATDLGWGALGAGAVYLYSTGR